MNAPEMMTDSEEEEQLLSWVRLARAADGRQSLTLAGVPRQIATTLPDVLASWTTTRAATEERRLLLSLRAVRNLCVGHPEAQDQVDQAGLVAALAHVCDSFLDCRDSSQRGLVLEAALQTLGNACVQHVKNQEATWSAFHPRIFKRVAALRGEDATLAHGPLCMVMMACVKGDESRVLAVVQPPAHILVELLQARAAVLPASDAEVELDQWLRILMTSLCFESQRLGAIYDAMMGSSPLGDGLDDVQAPTAIHGVMLHLLADGVDAEVERSKHNNDDDEQDAPYFTGMDTLRITVKALGNAARTLSQSQDVGAAATLRGALQLLRACASHDCALPECDDVVDATLLLLKLLAAVGPPPGLRSKGRQAGPSSDIETVRQPSSHLPGAGAYMGYRRDLVAALANACHRRAHVVDVIVQSDHVETVLHQCRGDDEDTFTREWALFAIRNMCEISSEAQAAIRSLEAQTKPALTE